MSTIAYRNGIMAADTRAYSGDRRPIGFKNKIHRLANGGLFAGSSKNPGTPESLFRWVNEHGVEKDLPEGIELIALVVQPNGDVWYSAGHKSFSGPLHGDYFAIGSGEDYAMAAMAMGADAAKAVSIAMIHDVWTGGEIVTMRLQEDDKSNANQHDLFRVVEGRSL